VAILSSDTHRGATFLLSSGVLKIFANNPEQEEAEEELLINYDGPELEIGLNLDYFLDVCSAIKSEEIKITLSGSSTSIIIQEPTANFPLYVIMPMKM
jgi:DNA polymerase III subunit beta